MKPHANPPTGNPETLLRLPDVLARVGLKKSSIYQMLNANPPRFPKPLKLSRRAVCWSSSSVENWIQGRIQAAGDQS